MTQFSATWSFLLENLEPGQVILNWTMRNGYIGADFWVYEIFSNRIDVQIKSSENIQRIPEKDFEFVWNNWQGYKSDQVHRKDLKAESNYTTYIISIFRWHDINSQSW